MGREHRPSADARLRAETHAPPGLSWLHPALIGYCVISGTVAVVVGVVTSLAVPVPQRLTLWALVTSAVAVVAGVARESRWLNHCRLAGARFLRRLARLSSTP